MDYTKRCDKCQRHANWQLNPLKNIHFITTTWSFNTWGVDIIKPFPKNVWQLKYLVVAVEYFTKWIGVESLVVIFPSKVQHFIWRNIVVDLEFQRC